MVRKIAVCAPAGPRVNTLISVTTRVPTHKDVKNADRSGDMYENKGLHDKLPAGRDDMLPENALFLRSLRIFDGDFVP